MGYSPWGGTEPDTTKETWHRAHSGGSWRRFVALS